MSAHTHPTGENAAGCLFVLFIYVLIGCAIYLVAYGEPDGFSLLLVVVPFLWPFALIWWSLWYIGIGIVLIFAGLGIKYAWDEL